MVMTVGGARQALTSVGGRFVPTQDDCLPHIARCLPLSRRRRNCWFALCFTPLDGTDSRCGHGHCPLLFLQSAFFLQSHVACETLCLGRKVQSFGAVLTIALFFAHLPFEQLSQCLQWPTSGEAAPGFAFADTEHRLALYMP